MVVTVKVVVVCVCGGGCIFFLANFEALIIQQFLFFFLPTGNKDELDIN